MEWAKVNLVNGLWKGALSAARDVCIAPANADREINLYIEVQSPEAHNLSRPVRGSRNGRRNNGRDRVFPSNGERIAGGDDYSG